MPADRWRIVESERFVRDLRISRDRAPWVDEALNGLRFALARNPTGFGAPWGQHLRRATFDPPGGQGNPVTFFWTTEPSTRTVLLLGVIVGGVL